MTNFPNAFLQTKHNLWASLYSFMGQYLYIFYPYSLHRSVIVLIFDFVEVDSARSEMAADQGSKAEHCGGDGGQATGGMVGFEHQDLSKLLGVLRPRWSLSLVRSDPSESVGMRKSSSVGPSSSTIDQFGFSIFTTTGVPWWLSFAHH